jgi:ABC-type multidrug transport system ATPase subunit
MLTLDGISHRFDTSPLVLDNLHLTFPAGQCVLVLGANGIGKTTFLKIIAGLLRPTSGRVRWHQSARLGVVLEKSFLFPQLSGLENLQFYQQLLGAAPDSLDRIAGTWGLKSFWHKPVRIMSRGQHQRLSLARATLHGPNVLILDEPQTGLDAESMGLLAAYLEGIQATGKLAFVATHDPDYLAHVAGRRVRLHAGCITEVL